MQKPEGKPNPAKVHNGAAEPGVFVPKGGFLQKVNKVHIRVLSQLDIGIQYK